MEGILSQTNSFFDTESDALCVIQAVSITDAAFEVYGTPSPPRKTIKVFGSVEMEAFWTVLSHKRKSPQLHHIQCFLLLEMKSYII